MDRRTAIERELSLIEAYERNLVGAIAKGQAMDPLLKKLEVEEARRAELTKELEHLTAIETVGSLDEARLKRELKARLSDLKGTAEAPCDWGTATPQDLAGSSAQV